MKRFKVRQIYLLFILILSGFLITGCGGSGGVTETGHWLPKDVMSIEVTPPNPIIATATTQQFMATGIYAENAHFDLTSSVTWSSSNTNIATISNATGSKGLASALTAGITTITATDTATGKSGYTTLTVKSTSVTLTSIAVTPVNPSRPLGINPQFTATGTFSDNTTQDLTLSVTWSSLTGSIATISNATGSKGLATTVAVGVTTIKATDSTGIFGTTNLTVTSATLVSIAVTPVNPSRPLGINPQFTATGTFSDNTTQDLTLSVTWSSLTESIATISNATGSKGLATTVAVGVTTIKAASGTISGTTNLTVTAVTLLSIEVTPVNPSIALGTKQQFIAMGTYDDASTQNLTSYVTWSTPLLTTPVASISNAADGSNGLATSLTVGGPIEIKATVPHTLPVISGTAHLTVTAATLVSIAVTPVSATIALGTTQQFIATGTYTDATTQVLTTSVNWTTPSMTFPVASISNAEGSKGLATSLAVGGPIRIHVIDPTTLKFGNAQLTVIAAPTPEDILAPFAIASYGGMTNAGATKINGDVVLDPKDTCNDSAVGAANDFGSICNTGANKVTNNAGDKVITPTYPDTTTAHAVMAALLTKWNSISPANLPGATVLGCGTIGTAGGAGAGIGCSDNSTLPPGTYISATGSTIGVTGTLTLDGTAADVWVFQANSALTTAVDSKIILTGGAKASNVWWFVGSSATLNGGTIFQGSVLASASISMGTGATSCGRLLAGAEGSGAFTFLGNTVSKPGHTNAPGVCQ